ncbi:hypothetical protein AURDEDRAFT_111006 [Auricularia subglabra TFB-10046 SS5]|nr:hypothetical protein AURDEDRAFT_111006 [Auricularia subglabra TFB-10046 SS5]
MQFKALALAFFPAAALAAQIKVAVGGTDFVFTPNTVTAQPGDEVVFTINGNHSVSQVSTANFNNPCGTAPAGIDSGFLASTQPTATFTVKVNDTNPVFLKCNQQVGGNHCSFGMVAAINPPTTGGNTFNAYMNAALNNACTAPASTTSSSSSGGFGYGYFACPGTNSASTTKKSAVGVVSVAIAAAWMLL